MSSKLHLFEIHYGGRFDYNPRKLYFEGSIHFVRNVDPDYWSWFELIPIIRDQLKYEEHEYKVFYSLPNVGLENGLIPLNTDTDMMNMFMIYEGRETIQIYVEHNISTSEAVTKNIEFSLEAQCLLGPEHAVKQPSNAFTPLVDILEDLDDIESIDSTYTPSDELRSYCSSDDEQLVDERISIAPFDIDDVISKPQLQEGLRFANARHFKWAVRQNAIYERFAIKMIKDDAERVTIKCKCETCPWRIHASWDSRKEAFAIKTFTEEHNCEKTDRSLQANSTWLSKRYLELIRNNPRIPIDSLETVIEQELGLGSTPSQIRRAKKKALDLIHGEVKEQYKKIRDYAHICLNRNPGSRMVIEVERPLSDGPSHFLRFCCCFGVLVKGFLQGCRPFLGLDGCFLKNEITSGVLLCAVAKDANNQMYPVAWGVAEGENKESWLWFLKNLLECIGPWEEHGCTFISDRQKGLVEAMAKLLPRAEHRYCVRHLLANFRNHFKGKELKDMLWNYARSSTNEIFDENMEKVKAKNKDAFTYLTRIPRAQWSRCGFRTSSKSDLLENNISECFNKWVLIAREKSAPTMLDMIRRQVMKRLHAKKENIIKWKQDKEVCPRVYEKLEDVRKESNVANHLCAGVELYEVCWQNERYEVDLNAKTCGCRMWQLSGIPCRHAYASIRKHRGKIEDYVDKCYKKQSYFIAYEGMIHPLPHMHAWPNTGGEKLEPPLLKKKPGRPKKVRKRGPDEVSGSSSSRNGNSLHCSHCGGWGHNKRTCKNPQLKASNKGRAGRPPLHKRGERQNHIPNTSRDAIRTGEVVHGERFASSSTTTGEGTSMTFEI